MLDGGDVVKVSGCQLWIEYEEWQLPAQISSNGKPWHLVWVDKVSAPFQDSNPAFPTGSSAEVKLIRLKGRGSVSIIQLLTSAYDQTLAFRIDDNAQGGADTFQIRAVSQML